MNFDLKSINNLVRTVYFLNLLRKESLIQNIFKGLPQLDEF